ncbi:MAG TPA: hypothetical protein VGJ55_16455 [Pyrinomonadaceae bacterium]|jgi:DNA-binding beta-propeller fold protein YncE
MKILLARHSIRLPGFFLALTCAIFACASGKLPATSIANIPPGAGTPGAESSPTQSARTEPLRLLQRIPLSKVEGRIDHLAVDVVSQRLFVAALGNNSLEVVDLKKNVRLQSVPGFHEPQGVGYLPGSNTIVVASGGDGAVTFLDGSSLKPLKKIRFNSDADNVRYDATHRRVYVGYGAGALGVLDEKGARLADVPLNGHPESFQLDMAAGKIFVNIPTRREIAVIDLNNSSVSTTWPVSVASANYPMALDEVNHRIFVMTRKPPHLLVYDTETEKLISNLETDSDCDDVFYDSARRRLYASFGEGTVVVYEQGDADHYKMIAQIPTAAGARTSFFSPELRRLYVAVPHRANPTAEILVYEVAP